VTNLVARNRDLHDSVLEAICQTFPLSLHIPVPEDVNEIVVGLLQANDDIIGQNTDQTDDGRQPFVVTPAVKDSVAILARMIQHTRALKTSIPYRRNCLSSWRVPHAFNGNDFALIILCIGGFSLL